MSLLIQKGLSYTVQIPLGDDDDYSKRMNVSVVKATTYLLWYKEAHLAGDATTPLDLTYDDMIGAYIQVSAATTISIQVHTVNGWEQLYMLGVAAEAIFTGADFIFFNIWLLPFQQIRFVTSAAATITIQCVVKE